MSYVGIVQRQPYQSSFAARRVEYLRPPSVTVKTDVGHSLSNELSQEEEIEKVALKKMAGPLLEMLERRQRQLDKATSNHWRALLVQQDKPSSIPLQLLPEISLTDTVQAFERETIINILDLCNWNKTHAARALKITRRVFAYRMQTLGITSEMRATK